MLSPFLEFKMIYTSSKEGTCRLILALCLLNIFSALMMEAVRSSARFTYFSWATRHIWEDCTLHNRLFENLISSGFRAMSLRNKQTQCVPLAGSPGKCWLKKSTIYLHVISIMKCDCVFWEFAKRKLATIKDKIR
jgi:hypothetical protein